LHAPEGLKLPRFWRPESLGDEGIGVKIRTPYFLGSDNSLLRLGSLRAKRFRCSLVNARRQGRSYLTERSVENRWLTDLMDGREFAPAMEPPGREDRSSFPRFLCGVVSDNAGYRPLARFPSFRNDPQSGISKHWATREDLSGRTRRRALVSRRRSSTPPRRRPSRNPNLLPP
jgi:hypothetical protein